MKVFLVRHAHAGDRHDWRDADRLRPLTEKGRRQAAGLVSLVKDERIARVLSSPYLRCIETVEPLANSRDLEVEPEASLAEGSDWHEALVLAASARVPTVLCSQGDVIGDVVAHLLVRGLIVQEDARAEKGSTWVLEFEEGHLRGASYEPPQGG